MKRILLFILSIILTGVIHGQQLFTSSLYDLQGVFHNPSVAGVQKHGVIGASYRAMWSGFDGNPKTATVFGSAYLPSAKIGLGGYIYSDKTGPTTRTGLQMAYAYHIPLKNEASFSFGIEARLQQFSFDRNKLQESLGSNDPVIGSTDNKFKADAGFGASYTGKNFQSGASVSQLIQTKLDFYNGSSSLSTEGRLYRHYYFHSKYDWEVDESNVITPNILFIYLPNAPLEVQGGVRLEHEKLFWIGLGYRSRQNWMLSAGVHIKRKFTIGYGFDIYTTPLSVYTRGGNAHEILLRYDFLK